MKIKNLFKISAIGLLLASSINASFDVKYSGTEAFHGGYFAPFMMVPGLWQSTCALAKQASVHPVTWGLIGSFMGAKIALWNTNKHLESLSNQVQKNGNDLAGVKTSLENIEKSTIFNFDQMKKFMEDTAVFQKYVRENFVTVQAAQALSSDIAQMIPKFDEIEKNLFAVRNNIQDVKIDIMDCKKKTLVYVTDQQQTVNTLLREIAHKVTGYKTQFETIQEALNALKTHQSKFATGFKKQKTVFKDFAHALDERTEGIAQFNSEYLTMMKEQNKFNKTALAALGDQLQISKLVHLTYSTQDKNSHFPTHRIARSKSIGNMRLHHPSIKDELDLVKTNKTITHF